MSNKPEVFAMVDDDDYEYLKRYIWTPTPDGYARRSKRRKEANGNNLSMHRIVTNCPNDMVVDHINFNKLDNRKGNLRIVTRNFNSSHKPSNKT